MRASSNGTLGVQKGYTIPRKVGLRRDDMAFVPPSRSCTAVLGLRPGESNPAHEPTLSFKVIEAAPTHQVTGPAFHLHAEHSARTVTKGDTGPTQVSTTRAVQMHIRHIA